MRQRINIALAGALALAVSPLPALAQEAPPEGGEPRSFELPDIETYKLRNGVSVTLVPYGRVPKTTIRAVVRVGNLNDGDTPWLADLTAGMMEEGAGERDAAETALAAAAMGGDLNIGVGLDETYVAMDVLSESAPDALALIAETLRAPAMPEDQFDRVKENLLRDVSVAASQPQSMASQAFYGALYPDHPYGVVLPDPDKVAALTLDDVKAFHADNFGGARTHIYVVGRFDRRQTRRAIEQGFRDWEAGPDPLILPSEGGEDAVVELVDRPGAVQSTIRLGKRTPPLDGSVDLEAADTLLGGYFSSRITRNIREDKGYTYSPGSFINARYKAANWQQNADITSEATGPALAEIVKEIRRLQDETPGAEEVTGVKNYMTGVFVIQLASRSGMAGQLAYVNLHELGLDYLEKFVDRVAALGAADFQEAAKTHLPVEEMTLVVAGDLETVRPQLEALPDFADRLPPKEETDE